MPIIIGLTPKGARRIADISAVLKKLAVANRLKALASGGVIEVSNPKLTNRFKPEHATGQDEELSRLGVSLIYRIGDDDKVDFVHGPSSAISDVLHQSFTAGQAPVALLHVIQNIYFPGIPRENVDALRKRLNALGRPVKVEVLASGAASSQGVAATGNLGALSLLRLFRRILKADVSVLNGGQGTRLFGLRKLKGDVLFGRNNLTIWNILTALYFRGQLPQGNNYHVSLANDLILVPFGRLTVDGELLSEVPPERARDGYFITVPDDPAQVSEKESQRFGYVARRRDGTFICATEKAGRAETLRIARQRLADRGETAGSDEIRLYISHFGMATSSNLEKDLAAVLETVIRPHVTADEVGDFDTFSLLYAALSSPSAAEFREAIRKMPLNKLLLEKITDEDLYAKLRKVLFVENIDGKLEPRFGFIDLNRDSIALDIGALPALFGFYLDMVKNFAPSGETRDKLLGYLDILKKNGSLTPGQAQAVADLEATLRNNERVTRATSQTIAGFDPAKLVENCEFEPDSSDPPIIGVATDNYTVPEMLRRTLGEGETLSEIQRIVSSCDRAKLKEHRNAQGQLLFLYDEEGIKSVKLVDSRIRPGAVIGRNTLVLDSEVGNGRDKVIVAENGAVVASRVEQSVTHKQPEKIDQTEVHKALKKIALSGKGEHRISLQGGWQAVITLIGNQQSADLADQIARQTVNGAAKDQRSLPEAAKLQTLLGIIEDEQSIELDLNAGEARFEIAADDRRSGTGKDPANIYKFSLRYERDQRPVYIIYGREQTAPLEIYGNAAFVSKQPLGNAPAMNYTVPFDADPGKTRLALYGGIVMKDARMQEEFGYFTRFRLKTSVELLNAADRMATEIANLFRQLPAVTDMPNPMTTDDVPMIVNVGGIANAIQVSAGGAGKNTRDIKQAIMQELGRQTPTILARFISLATGLAENTVKEALDNLKLEVNHRHDRKDINQLFTALGIDDPAQKRLIEDIIDGYPLSDRIFKLKDHRMNSRGFSRVIEALIEQYRMVEVKLMEPIDPAAAADAAMDAADAAVLPSPSNSFVL